MVAIVAVAGSLTALQSTLDQVQKINQQSTVSLEISELLQSVSLETAERNLTSQTAIESLGRRIDALESLIERIGTSTNTSAPLAAKIIFGYEHLADWQARLATNPTPLMAERASLGFRDALEVIGEALSENRIQLAAESENLVQIAALTGTISIFALILASYLMVFLYLGLRAIDKWNQLVSDFIADRQLTAKTLPSLKVPAGRFFPGSLRLLENSITIAKSLQLQIAEESKLSAELLLAKNSLEVALAKIESVQAQNIRSERFAAIGKVAGSVSHEINNPITGVMGYLAFLKRKNQDENLAPWIDKAIREVDRIGRISKNLLIFSRKTAGEQGIAFDLSSAIHNTLDLVGAQMRESAIEVVTDISDDLPKVFGRSDELQQSLLNLLINAKYALKNRPIKRIELSVARLENMVELSVQDTGAGVAAEIRPHLFEPFVTNKPAGEGSGLGLSVTAELMKHFGGAVRHDESYEDGARFVLSLPIYVEPAVPVQPTSNTTGESKA